MIDNSPHRTPPLNYNTNTNVLSICRALWRILWAKMENLASKNIFWFKIQIMAVNIQNNKEVVNSQSSQ